MKLTSFIFIMMLLAARIVVAAETDQKFTGFNLQGYNEEGSMTWEVNGDTANIVGNEIILSNVDADTFGDQKVNVVAETGIVDQVSGKMHLKKDVVVTSETGQRLVTDSLDWSRDKDLVTTEDDVMITGDNMMANGTGMDARPNLKNAKIKKDVTVVVDAETEQEGKTEPVTITSDGPMVIDQLESIATFEENVVAIRGDQTLKGDRLEIYFDEKMDNIQKMVCSGNVEIEQGENKSYAQKAVYDGATRKLTLSGRPKLIMLTEEGGLFAAAGN